MAVLTAVDPGDVYTGVAFFDPADNVHGWECTGAVEFSPYDFVDALAESVFANEVPILVFERFRLYNDKAVEQTGSEMLTSQQIGQIKMIVRLHNQHCARHVEAEKTGLILPCEIQGYSCADADIRWQPTLLIGQRTDIKKPAAGILRGKRIKSVAKPIDRAEYSGRGHIVDAELHGWYHILEGSVTGKDSEIYFADLAPREE